mmetsp:Transcript_31623/g.56781  ORF Transcript_31623/g.56781 Transcript_31623/m.56781 type:complete len:208 (-) Transcript_31623:144-767(-)
MQLQVSQDRVEAEIVQTLCSLLPQGSPELRKLQGPVQAFEALLVQRLHKLRAIHEYLFGIVQKTHGPLPCEGAAGIQRPQLRSALRRSQRLDAFRGRARTPQLEGARVRPLEYPAQRRGDVGSLRAADDVEESHRVLQRRVKGSMAVGSSDLFQQGTAVLERHSRIDPTAKTGLGGAAPSAGRQRLLERLTQEQRSTRPQIKRWHGL